MADVDWRAYVATLAEVHGLTLATSTHEAVAEQLQRIATMAHHLSEFDLPVDIEPAPVFRP